MERSEVRFQLSNPTSPREFDPNRSNFFDDQSVEMYQVSSPEPGFQQSPQMYSQQNSFNQNPQVMYRQVDPRMFQNQNTNQPNGSVQWSDVQGQRQPVFFQQQQQQQQRPQQPWQQQTQQPLQQRPQQPQQQQVQSQGGRPPHQDYLRQFHFLYPHNRDPNEKLPEQPHIQEQEHLKNLHLHQGSVCQFPTKIRNPEEKLPEQPHIGEVEELSHLHLHQGSVCQFPTKVRNPEEKMVESSHIGEQEHLKNLHLKQGSVVQFPSKLQSTKFDYFHPPEIPMKELLPVAQVKQDHCLPSQARQQQTYITHPSPLPAKLMVRGGTASPDVRGQSPAQWPPEDDQPHGGRQEGQKNFIWPPPKREYYGSCQDLPPPGPENIAGTSWKISQPGERLSGLRSYAPSRRQYNWPPNGRQGLRKQSGPMDVKSRSLLELDEVITARPPGSVASYRPPPWSQFFKPGYYNQA